ncbi:MAG: hypothetical protein ACFB2Z_10160 [Maricaulaceae bacterium]
MIPHRLTAILLSLCVTAPLATAQTDPQPWVELVQGAHPGVSALVAYDDRIWFAQSDPFENANIANVWSYDPGAGESQFERALFSQDVGDPLAWDGRLFWPFEDPRRSTGRGEFAVVDAERRWAWGTFQVGRAFHVHTLGRCQGALMAGTGAFDGELLRSQDDGRAWALAGAVKPEAAPFARVVSITEVSGRCFLGTLANRDPRSKVMEWTTAGIVAVPGGPTGNRADKLVGFDGRLFALSGGRIWRFDTGAEVWADRAAPARGPRAFSAHDGVLWLVTGRSGQGALWRSADGETWAAVQRFDQTPISVLATDIGVFVGTYDRADGGRLWGPEPGATRVETPSVIASQDWPPTAGPSAVTNITAIQKALAAEPPDWRVALSRILEVSEAAAYGFGPRAGEALTALLDQPLPAGTIDTGRGGALPAGPLLHWALLSQAASLQGGRVPVTLLRASWITPDNSRQKYFDPILAAILAVGWVGQDDPATLDALIDRLEAGADPEWLADDVAGALGALSGVYFATDAEAWRTWFVERFGGDGSESPVVFPGPAGRFGD